MTDQAERYRKDMGREPPPPVPEDHPLAWQWDYRGTKQEREQLRDELFPADEPNPPEVHPDQTDIFGGDQ